MSRLRWERIEQEGEIRIDLVRARIPQGWLVASSDRGLAFVPDAGGQWDFDELSASKVQQSVMEIEHELGDLAPPGA